jgi:DNA-binding CsgD family transcriptional regulator
MAKEQGLTPRHWEVVDLASEGKGNEEIAKALMLSVKTVESHKSHLQERLGLNKQQLWAEGVQSVVKEQTPLHLDNLELNALAYMARTIAFPVGDSRTRLRDIADMYALEDAKAAEVIRKLETNGYIEREEPEFRGWMSSHYLITANGWRRIFPFILEKAKQADLL